MLAAARRVGGPSVTSLTPAEARERVSGRRALLGEGPPVAAVREITIDGSEPPIPARLYVPHNARAGIVVYFHGGGWVLGDLADYDPLGRSLAAATNTSVLSVGYRLAPEHPFPAAVDDAWTSLRWAAAELSGSGPIVVIGDSAGGTLAAVCTHSALGAGRPEIALQVLVYPVTDHNFDTESYRRYATGLPLGRDEMEWFWDHYVPDVVARDDPRASPLRYPSFSALPPTLMFLAEHDPVRDDGLAYAESLRFAGVSTTVHVIDDVHHGFFALATYLTRADEVVSQIGAAVRELSEHA